MVVVACHQWLCTHQFHCLSRRSPFHKSSSSTELKFSSQEALILLQKCTSFHHLKLIHAKIIRHGLSRHQLLIRKLLHLCFSCGEIEYATLLFNQIDQPQTFTWNFMVRAYTFYVSPRQALLLFNLMISQGFPPDKFTFPFVFKACLSSSSLREGQQVHALAIKSGFFKDTFVHNTLMDLYFKCGDVVSGCNMFDKMRVRNIVSWTTFITGLIACKQLDAARVAFDQMPIRNVVSWTSMINGYVQNQRPQEAFQLFFRMELDNVKPNEFTLVCLLKACTQLGSLRLGRWIHYYALKNRFELGGFLGTALIDMYSKCGSLKDARQVFDMIQVKNLATWNTMITSLGVHGYGDEALALFALMEYANIQPDAITFVGVLCACVLVNNVKDGDRHFNRMKTYYGITPVREHYICMIELYGRANMLNDACQFASVMSEL